MTTEENILVEGILQIGKLEKDWADAFFNIKKVILDLDNPPPSITKLRDDLLILLDKIIIALIYSFQESREKTMENWGK
jgi:hypothetical protein